MDRVSLFRLYLLRATYLFIVAGLGFLIWPSLLNPPEHTEHMRGVVRSLLAGVSLLALLGLRYPLQMLPLLLFELVWKSIWLLAIGLPLWSAGAFDAGTRQTWSDCLISIVIFLLVIPWGYVLNQYVRQPGTPWRSHSARRFSPPTPVECARPRAEACTYVDPAPGSPGVRRARTPADAFIVGSVFMTSGWSLARDPVARGKSIGMTPGFAPALGR